MPTSFCGTLICILSHLWPAAGPISRDIAILSLRYPISRDTPFREVSNPPKWCDTPPLVLSFTQTHLCDTPFCYVSRDNCAILPKRQARKHFAIPSLQVSLLGLLTCGLLLWPVHAQHVIYEKANAKEHLVREFVCLYQSKLESEKRSPDLHLRVGRNSAETGRGCRAILLRHGKNELAGAHTFLRGAIMTDNPNNTRDNSKTKKTEFNVQRHDNEEWKSLPSISEIFFLE